MRLPEEQARLLEGLASLPSGERIDRMAAALSIDQARVAAAAVLLSEQGLVEIREEPYVELVLHDEGRAAIAGGLPERKILRAIRDAGGELGISEAPARTGLEAKEIGRSLRWLAARGWATKEGSLLRAAGAGEPGETADEKLLRALAGSGKATADELRASGLAVEEAIELLKGRPSWCEARTKVRRFVSVTGAGRGALEKGIEVAVEVSQLTPELLASGKWREVKLRAYDVGLATEPVYPGKRHPMQRVLDETRRVFLEMGFQEIVSSLVESSFWDFDALFQPQDHPAREMQDTFHLDRPDRIPLPEARELVERVRRAHEDGGDTGSIGWQYPWSAETAQKAVLRTHTTATTVRALAADPVTPRRVFSVGRVFRRETIDYKHLPVFYQVDGIVIDPEASFANLLGTLAAFYRKMGFAQFRFRPGFFPYTEPSVEVYIYYEKKRDWVEMGGAGVFRPEVTRPLGCSAPVLAWGLGLERIAMLRYDLADIRELYLPDTEWLKGAPLCR